MKYQPIDCALHDYLEIACSNKLEIEIVQDDGSIIKGKAMNVYSKDQAEWMLLEPQGLPGSPIRLDRICSIKALTINPYFELLELKR
ncbi:Rho-binding antiterminator [Motilimonas eburnea]|uniref:Rho-binding antiterminator n=1 Tax=Motilimonas eburnea TaxID=1737488 RepID=UPI001E2D666A|nr:Rho-binding antiterminator [Motilimonas eburnea]MCE2572963.1 Rho-binding antiterminator [Motilimonas eburnea]